MLDKVNKIRELSFKIRKTILDISFNSGEPSHIGGALSMVEILAVIYSYFNIRVSKQLDRFVLSKGHGCLAYYASLFELGHLSEKELLTFEKNDSELLGHPVRKIQSDCALHNV